MLKPSRMAQEDMDARNKNRTDNELLASCAEALTSIALWVKAWSALTILGVIFVVYRNSGTG